MIENRPITPQLLLEWLVENAMDFVTRSIDEFGQAPKYSIIHFYSAVELFLKARLLAEHWSLVVSAGKIPDWEKFVEGDFVSVSLEQAAEKLRKTVRSPLGEKEFQAFKKLASHRNKTVHFFHGSFSTESSEQMREDLVKERLNVWYFLHKALTEQWAEIFSDWSEQLDGLNHKMYKLGTYLEVVYDQLSPEIFEKQTSGTIWVICPSCTYRAIGYPPMSGGPNCTECFVCGFASNYLTINCPNCNCDCGEPVLFIDDGHSKCTCCKHQFDPEQLAQTFIDPADAHRAAKDGDNNLLGNCGECEGYHTVVHIDEANDSYFCTSCFDFFEVIKNCGWCGEPNTGDMENSSWAGCSACGGRRGFI